MTSQDQADHMTPELGAVLRRTRQWAETKSLAQIQREIRRSRSLARRLGAPASYRWWLKVGILKAIRHKHADWSGGSEWFAEWADDLPIWAIPGASIPLNEYPDDLFCMSWPVVSGGASCQAHAVMEQSTANSEDVVRETWLVWLVPAQGNSSFLGFFASQAEARRATGIEPGLIVDPNVLLRRAWIAHLASTLYRYQTLRERHNEHQTNQPA